MLKIAQNPTFMATVSVNLLSADSTETTQSNFTAIFNRPTQAQIDELNARIGTNSLTDREVVNQVLAGWGPDVQDDQGNPLEYNPTNLEALLQVYPVQGSIVTGFFGALRQARAKN